MSNIKYQGKSYVCREGESILDAFLRQGVGIPFSCRNGVCQVCLQRSVSGKPPQGSQKGLKESLAAKNYFLPCICRPSEDMEFAPPLDDDLYFKAVVAEKGQLGKDVWRILLEPTLEVNYRSGQFINLRRADGVIRSYSLASVPGEDYYLELQVKRMKNGVMSNWLIDELEVGSEIDIQGPNGECFYEPGKPDQNMMLVGTGTGLAPLMGLVRSALAAGHTGEIHLYHGSSYRDGLYLVNELRELSEKNPNFRYVPCVSRETAPEHFFQGRAHGLAFAQHENLNGWRVHLAGNPDMVESAVSLATQAGAEPADIFDDSFVLKDLRSSPRAAPEQKPETPESERRVFPPDPEMWAALQEGKLLEEILTDFYTRVFDDPVLSPYFHKVTRQRLIEKVYSFLKQVFTGEKIYFGDRPRNAHHWMVIPDDVFDYREKLMTSVIREHGLDEHLIDRWNAIEESFRGDIVKLKPYGRVLDGIEFPVDGFGHEVMEVGAVCDSCERIIEPGENVSYHLRTGQIYCTDCHKD